MLERFVCTINDHTEVCKLGEAQKVKRRIREGGEENKGIRENDKGSGSSISTQTQPMSCQTLTLLRLFIFSSKIESTAASISFHRHGGNSVPPA